MVPLGLGAPVTAARTLGARRRRDRRPHGVLLELADALEHGTDEDLADIAAAEAASYYGQPLRRCSDRGPYKDGA